ncbi:MAG: class I SAM-dependent methyltransferase [Rhodothermia bacterium]|nr:class I SAM-dependent methyltransferase [Rhodothermia bacterium]
MTVYNEERFCRSCQSLNLTTVLEYGQTPLSDRLTAPTKAHDEVPLVPLTLTVCNDCTLVQIKETVPPHLLFDDAYPYFSSVSPSLVRHFRQSARHLIETRGLDGKSLVVEAASNDGCMLRNFVENGIPVLGIDPAGPPVQLARSRGVRTLKTFFDEELALQLRRDEAEASVFLANNVLAHVADLNGFVAGITHVLAPHGIAVLEVPYLPDLLDKVEFDTVYHQHLCYFSITSLASLFERHGLFINRVERISIHGGSVRLYAEHRKSVDDSVLDLLEYESNRQQKDLLQGFVLRVQQVKVGLRNLLREIRNTGARVAAYGAAAKGNTLASYCGLTRHEIEYIVDLNEYKQGLLFGQDLIPICAPSRLLEDLPDYVLILAWNFADEIMDQQQEYMNRGGRFIIPIPEPVIA